MLNVRPMIVSKTVRARVVSETAKAETIVPLKGYFCGHGGSHIN